MAIFRIFNIAATAIFDFQNCEILTVGRVNRVKEDVAFFQFFKMSAATVSVVPRYRDFYKMK